MPCLALSLVVLVLLSTAGLAPAQATLPLVDGAAAEPLREHGRQLLRALEAFKAPLPTDTVRALKTLLTDAASDPATLPQRIQELLDPHCLIGVTINPESRVKA